MNKFAVRGIFILFMSLMTYSFSSSVAGIFLQGFIPFWGRLSIFFLGFISSSVLLVWLERRLLLSCNLNFWPIVVSVLSAVIILRRADSSIYDLFTPTDLIGGVTRAANGLIPFSFANFPDIYANYHAHFILASSILKNLLGTSTLHSILLCYALGAASLSVVVLDFCRIRYNWGVKPAIVFLCVLLFASSFPSRIGYDPIGWPRGTDFVMIADIILSNSWAYGLTAMLLLVAAIDAQKNIGTFVPGYVAATLLGLSLIVTNGVVFTLGVGTWICFSLLNFPYLGWRRFALVLFSCALAIFASRFIPSVNLVGPLYAKPEVGIRSFHDLFTPTVAWYIQLLGPFSFLAVGVLGHELWNGRFSVLRRWNAADYLFLFAFLMPFLLIVRGISEWDSIHKNAVICIFLSLFVLADRQRKFCFLAGRRLATLVVLLGLVTLPNLVDFYRRISTSTCYWCQFEEIEEGEEVSRLKKLSPSVMFPVDRVSLDKHSFQNSLSGNFTKNSIFPGFLVVLKEGEYPRNDRFRDVQWMRTYIKRQKYPGYLQIPAESASEISSWFRTNEDQFEFKLDWSHKIEVGRYEYIPILWD